MAALRIFARSSLSTIRATGINGDSWKNHFPRALQIQKRWQSLRVEEGKSMELPEFEVTRDPKEWEFVDWALRVKIIPKPPGERENFPSGWKPAATEAKSLPYYVERTRNYMIPVYLERSDRGMRRVTKIRKVQGDIMLLEKELRAYVEKKTGKVIGSQINEPASLIKFRGDHVALCMKFLSEKGF